ncbi:IS3 family transposase [Pantoea agglomerans]
MAVMSSSATKDSLYVSLSWCFGYQRIWQRLLREDHCVNHRRVYHICHLIGLSLKAEGIVKGW